MLMKANYSSGFVSAAHTVILSMPHSSVFMNLLVLYRVLGMEVD